MDLDNDVAPESLALATLVHLARRAREASGTNELIFIALNETYTLIPYRQGVLWLQGKGVVAISGVVSLEANAPYVLWLHRVCRHLAKANLSAGSRILDTQDLPVQEIKEWGEWLPEHGLWLPLPGISYQFRGGGLLLARETPWGASDCAFLAEWSAILSHAWAFKQSYSRILHGWHRLRAFLGFFLHLRFWLTVALISVLFVPVHLTVLAPAELVPLHPDVIRAPMDGVIDQVMVLPNQSVVKDQPLFEFDRANIKNRLLVAEYELATVRSEYRQKAQQAFSNPESRAQVSILKGKISEREVDVNYLKSLYERGLVVAPNRGIVLFDDPTEWIGRPVVTGERVMMVADDHAVEIEAWLSPGDAIPFQAGARIILFLNANPLEPVMGMLRYVTHEATLRPDGNYAYRVRASITGSSGNMRLGLKGTAKLEGDGVKMWYWVFRRPIATVRAWLGW